jgi:hypothetical protein
MQVAFRVDGFGLGNQTRVSFAPSELDPPAEATQGLRPGLYSFAVPRLALGGGMVALAGERHPRKLRIPSPYFHK